MVETLARIKINKDRNKSMPLYRQIHRKLRETIEKGDDIYEGDYLPSISVLAKRLDVHYRTVKAAYELLEKDGTIKYQTNKGAVLIRKRSSTIRKSVHKMTASFVTWHHRGAFFVHVAEGIKQFFTEQDIDYSLVDVGTSKDRFVEAVSNMGGNVDGLLVLPLEQPGYAEAIGQALQNGTKVVLVDRHLPGVDVASVEPGHFEGAYKATLHLLEQHKRAVYYLGITEKPSSCRDWMSGWAQAMYEYNFCDLKSHCIDLGVSEEELATSTNIGLEYYVDASMRLFNSKKEDVYCIYAGNDFVARGVYIAAEKLGLEVGKNVFVVGNDDMPFAQTFDVPLSSIRQIPSINQVGYEAAKLLYQYIIGAVEKPIRRLLPTELIVRQSSTGIVSKVV